MVEIHEHKHGLLIGTMFMVSARKGGWVIRKSNRRRETFFVSKNMLSIVLILIIFFVAKVYLPRWSASQSTNNILESTTRPIEKKEERHFVAYSKKRSFLTRAEKTFYSTLNKALDNKYLLFAQIGMLGIFDLKRIYDKKDYYLYLHKIQAKRIDFLVCDKRTTEPLFAIELDDWTHARADRIKRDDYVDQVFKDANLPLLRIKSAFESEEGLKNKFKPYLSNLTSVGNAGEYTQ